jgi:hypothetical protein
VTTSTECVRCGTSILLTTATRTGGLCMPCKGGWRENIEAARHWYQEERDREANDPLRALWRTLVRRVHATPSGFDGLSPAERLYFSVRILVGDVYNGGFIQYFDNAAETYHEYAIRGLKDLGASESLALLEKARALLRPHDLSDSDDAAELSPATEAELDGLAQRFWADPDDLEPRLERFAREHQLLA